MKHLRRVVALAIGVAAFLVPAAAASADPAPGYEEFSDCPDKSVDSAITTCVVTDVDGGHLQLGSKNTPIEDPIQLVVGVNNSGVAVPGSFDGGRQEIPGGLVGITGLNWLVDIFPFDLLKVYAEAELAGPVTTPLQVVGLPLKVKVDNPLLNEQCYIGADSDPISLNLTTGTTDPPPPNEPISGQPGTLSADPNLPGVLRSTNAVLVDNAFAAPAARNCDLLALDLLVTTLVNAQAGLPSPAGTNEAVQEADISLANVTNIYPPDGTD